MACMSSRHDKGRIPGNRCHCSPCLCVECGDVIGVYEPLVAVLGEHATHASLLAIDLSGVLGQALAYHEVCFRDLSDRSVAGAGAGATSALPDGGGAVASTDGAPVFIADVPPQASL